MIRSLYAIALCGALLFPLYPVQAETVPDSALISLSAERQSKLTASVQAAPRQAGTPVTATNGITATQVISPVQAPAAQPAPATTTLTATAAVTATEPLPLPTPTAALTATAPADGVPDPAFDTQYAGVLEGTIIANRTAANVRFFVEGQVYDLAPLRALGLPLPRPTAVLNLFNCDARQAEDAAGCFWDPYLLKQDGFYEVVTGADAGALVSLSLQEAGAPPGNEIWVQNRTGERESIIVNDEIVEVAPASVQQFVLQGEGPIVVHVRNCINQGEQSACEWAPQGVEPGYYYALVKLVTTGANNTTITTSKLEPVVASSGEVVERPVQASCLLRVPTLNVRGGPGLEFPVIAKVRGSEAQPGSVVVVGFDASKQWMQVSDRIAAGGWVTSNPDFIICTGDLTALPVAGVAPAAAAAEAAAAATADAAAQDQAAAPVAEAPAEPVVETPVDDTAAAPVEAPVAEAVPEAPAAEELPAEPAAEATEAPAEEPTATPAASDIPTGLARLVVNNGFDQVMRFTLDQKYRVETDNLSGEWDLQPGQSISILVYPGMIPFSVSTPWRGLSDNADVTVEEDQERALWLYFIPDPDGSGNWILQF